MHVVLVTCPSLEEAETISRAIVTERLAACVNVIPALTSYYIWEGAMQKDSEVLMVIKTRQECLEDLEKRVKQLHSYSIPEFIALPITTGSPEYLDWLATQTTAP